TPKDQQRSTLLRLPAELRLQIFELVLGGSQIRICDVTKCAIRLHKCRSRKQKLRYDTYFHLRRRHLALLVTCRQIHTEAKLLPFARNEFHGHHWSVHLAMYYRLTDAQVRAITNLRV
ncbi:hypothetical protein BDW02DRAFT_481961, partial [Decorospora gaudefroyi]